MFERASKWLVGKYVSKWKRKSADSKIIEKCFLNFTLRPLGYKRKEK